MGQLSHEGLILGPHDGSQGGLDRANELELLARIVSVEDVELQLLMLLKVVFDKETFLEVGVQVVHDLFAAAEFRPASLILGLFLVHYAHGV